MVLCMDYNCKTWSWARPLHIERGTSLHSKFAGIVGSRWEGFRPVESNFYVETRFCDLCIAYSWNVGLIHLHHTVADVPERWTYFLFYVNRTHCIHSIRCHELQSGENWLPIRFAIFGDGSFVAGIRILCWSVPNKRMADNYPSATLFQLPRICGAGNFHAFGGVFIAPRVESYLDHFGCRSGCIGMVWLLRKSFRYCSELRKHNIRHTKYDRNTAGNHITNADGVFGAEQGENSGRQFLISFMQKNHLI